jgi:UDP-glucose:(glucosyl)LPS alpha-1,2-glucosyltransferase
LSCIYNGNVIETEQSKNAMGGTEMMRSRLIANIDPSLLKGVAIHLSRCRKIYKNTKNILWCHDLAEDPENRILENGNWERFDCLVFVSVWQRDQYILNYEIPYSKCVVIENAIELKHRQRYKPTDKVRIIYHTTPHRGLELAYPIFVNAAKQFNNIHLDVFSSFEAYGWSSRDVAYKNLFDALKSHEKITYHGYKPNNVVLEYLENSHIFLYPCIWKETSCISLIEAIRAGCLPIHPNYGALTETGASASLTYDYSEDYSENATRCYITLMNVLHMEKMNNGWINRHTNGDCFSSRKHDIETFSHKWKSLLEKIKNVK